MPTLSEFRFAFRMLRRSPAFTAVAILSLALGIGANTAIFSVMDALLLRSLPVQHPEQLVMLGTGRSDGIFGGFPSGRNMDLYSIPFLEQLRARNSVFSNVAAMESLRVDVHARFSGASDLEPLRIRVVSGDYFQTLGVLAATGRVFTIEDDNTPGGHPIAVLSYAFWQRRFSRESNVIGRTFTFNKTAFTVVGVAARDFSGTLVEESPDVWIPLAMQAQVQPWLRDPNDALSQFLWLMGRLKPGITRAEAEANVNVVFQQWLHQVAGAAPSAEQVQDMKKAHVPIHDASNGFSQLRLSYANPLWILMSLVGVVLLIACANLANLLLARGTGRQREIAVRLALGAERRTLIAQLLSESVLLSLAGGVLGVLAAWWGGQLLIAMVASGPDTLPLQVGPNARVLLFTFLLSLLTGLLFGIIPAFRMTGIDVGPSLKEGKGLARSQSRSLLGQALVAGQVALSLLLLIGAGLFVGTLGKLQQTNVGFDKDRVIRVQFEGDAFNLPGTALSNLCRRLEARIRALPDVENTSLSMLNFGEGRWVTGVWPEGVEHIRANAHLSDGNRVGTEYFRALGVPVVLGRMFGPRDTAPSQHTALVNETLAQTLYPHVSPVGRRLSAGDKYDLEIVGVVKDSHYGSLRETPRGMFYVPVDQDTDSVSDMVVRAHGNLGTLMTQIRAVVRSVDPNVAVAEMSTLSSLVDDSISQEKLLAKLAGFFGVLALLLSSIGLYGLIAYSVAQRTNEIGIRMALGAQPGSVLRMVLRESLILVGCGLAAGIPAALACGRLVSSQLYGLKPSDPLTIAAASVVLLLVAMMASFLPARRAALLDPLSALRQE